MRLPLRGKKGAWGIACLPASLPVSFPDTCPFTFCSVCHKKCFKISPGKTYRVFQCTDFSPRFLSLYPYSCLERGAYCSGLPEPGAILEWFCDLGDMAFPLLPSLSPFPSRSSSWVLAPRPLTSRAPRARSARRRDRRYKQQCERLQWVPSILL